MVQLIFLRQKATLSDKSFAVTDDFIGKSVSEITADGNRFLWHFDFSEDYSISKDKLDFSDRERLSLITKPNRLHSSNDRRTPFKTFIIGFEEARAFRKAQGSFLRANQWSDLTVDVYLEY